MNLNQIHHNSIEEFCSAVSENCPKVVFCSSYYRYKNDFFWTVQFIGQDKQNHIFTDKEILGTGEGLKEVKKELSKLKIPFSNGKSKIISGITYYIFNDDRAFPTALFSKSPLTIWDEILTGIPKKELSLKCHYGEEHSMLAVFYKENCFVLVSNINSILNYTKEAIQSSRTSSLSKKEINAKTWLEVLNLCKA